MASLSTRTFYTLSAVAFPLLLGGLAVNGTLFAMYRAWSSGEFAPGQPCYHVYSGFPIIDQFEAIQVTFWSPIVTDGLPRLQAMMLCASLQTAGLWAAIENSRRGDRKHWILRFAPIYCFFWGACGVATLLPIYCHIELEHRRGTTKVEEETYRMSLSKAKALLPALFIGLAYPYCLMLFPPTGTTVSQHQSWITLYQFSPFFVYAAVQTFGAVWRSQTDNDADSDADAPFVKAAYLISAAWSAVAYVSALGIVLTSSDPAFSVWKLFVPSLASIRNASPDTHIREGSYLFMQLDYLIVAAACVLYAAKTVERMCIDVSAGNTIVPAGRRTGAFGAAAMLTGGLCVLLGPGAMGSLVLYIREGWLRKESAGERAQREEKR